MKNCRKTTVKDSISWNTCITEFILTDHFPGPLLVVSAKDNWSTDSPYSSKSFAMAKSSLKLVDISPLWKKLVLSNISEAFELWQILLCFVSFFPTSTGVPKRLYFPAVSWTFVRTLTVSQGNHLFLIFSLRNFSYQRQ